MILGKYQVTTLARKQPVSLKWCHLLPFPSPFWYLVSKKIHNYLGIIHTWRLLRGITVKICKIHWKFRIKQTSWFLSLYSVILLPDGRHESSGPVSRWPDLSHVPFIFLRQLALQFETSELVSPWAWCLVSKRYSGDEYGVWSEILQTNQNNSYETECLKSLIGWILKLEKNCTLRAIQDNSKQSWRNSLNNYQTCLIVNI